MSIERMIDNRPFEAKSDKPAGGIGRSVSQKARRALDDPKIGSADAKLIAHATANPEDFARDHHLNGISSEVVYSDPIHSIAVKITPSTSINEIAYDSEAIIVSPLIAPNGTALVPSESLTDAEAKRRADAEEEKEAPSFGPKIKLSMFDPDPSKVEMPYHIVRFFGKSALEYAQYRFATPDQRRAMKDEHLRRDPGMKPNAYYNWKQRHVLKLRQNIDSEGFSQAIIDAYKLQPNEDPMELYKRAMRNANATVLYMLNHTVPRQMGAVGLKTEPGLVIDNPERIFQYAFDTNIDDRLQFEVRRQMLLGIVCAELDLYVRRSGLEHNIREVNEILNDSLFAGKRGESKRRDFVFIYQRGTNKVLRYHDSTNFERDQFTGKLIGVPHDSENELVVEDSLEMRLLKGSNISVQYEPRLKNMAAAAGKAIQDELLKYENGKSDGTIYPLKQGRKDLMGMLLVVDGDQSSADQVIDQIFDVLTSSPLMEKLYDVIPDDKTNGTSDQSPEYNHGRRIRVKGIGDNNLPIQWEIIVQPLLDYKNGNEQIGVKDPVTGRYNGIWHDGYKTERHLRGKTGGMLTLLQPDEIFNRDGRKIDLVKEAGKTKNRKATLVLLP